MDGAKEKMGMRGMILLWGKGDPWEPRRRIWKGGQVGKKMSLGELSWGLVLASKPKEVVRGLRGVGGWRGCPTKFGCPR